MIIVGTNNLPVSLNTDPPETQKTITSAQERPTGVDAKFKGPDNQIPPHPTQETNELPQLRSKSFLNLTLGILIVVLLGTGGFLAYQNFQTRKIAESSLSLSPTQMSPSPFPNPTMSWKTYRNDEYGFEVKYPKDFFISSEDPHESYNYDYWVIFTPEEWKNKGIHNPFIGVSIIKTNLTSEEWLNAVGTSTSVFDDLSSLTEQEREKTKEAIYFGVKDKDIVYEETDITSDGQIVKFSESRTSGSDYHVLMKGKNNLLFNIHNHISPNGEIAFDIFNQVLSTFKFIEQKEKDDISELWDPICGKEDLTEFDVPVRQGEGITHVARNALNGYITSLNLLNMPNKSYSLTPEEKVYAEDYIRKKLNPTNIKVGAIVIVECSLTEEAVIKARLLTISQKQNLQEYSKNVDEFQVIELIQEIIEETTPEGGTKPYIFTP